MTLLPSFGNYSKFVNAGIGVVVGAGVAWLATKGLAVCESTADPNLQACTVFGIAETQIREAIVGIVTLLFVHQSPPNIKT